MINVAPPNYSKGAYPLAHQWNMQTLTDASWHAPGYRVFCSNNTSPAVYASASSLLGSTSG